MIGMIDLRRFETQRLTTGRVPTILSAINECMRTTGGSPGVAR